MSLSKKFHKDPSFRCGDIYKMIPDSCNHQFSMDFAYFQTTLDHDHAHTIPFRTIQDFNPSHRFHEGMYHSPFLIGINSHLWSQPFLVHSVYSQKVVFGCSFLSFPKMAKTGTNGDKRSQLGQNCFKNSD